MNNFSISVIIPVYNGEQHIVKCYESLCKQSLKNWEAVFIDDGSNDNSASILDRLTSDHRVKIIHKKNEGVAVARENGIKSAKGEFLTFLDVDDTLTTDALKKFLAGFSSDDIDIVIAGLNLVTETGKPIQQIDYSSRIYYAALATERLCDGRLRWQLCGKAFRKSVIGSAITPRGLRSAEDMAVCIQAVLAAKKVRILNESLYNYVQVPSSVTHSKARSISFDALKAVDFVNDCVGNKIKQSNLDCLYLLIISAALRSGIDHRDRVFINALNSHFSFSAIRRLSIHKTISLCLFRWFGINLAKFL